MRRVRCRWKAAGERWSGKSGSRRDHSFSAFFSASRRGAQRAWSCSRNFNVCGRSESSSIKYICARKVCRMSPNCGSFRSQAASSLRPVGVIS